MDNFLVQGGLDLNFILETTAGEFVVQTSLWGDQARQIAELIAARIGQPIRCPVENPQAETRLTAAEHRGVRLMRAFGWVCTVIAGILMALLLFAIPFAKPEDRWELAKSLLFFGFVFSAAQALRRFKVRMG